MYNKQERIFLICGCLKDIINAKEPASIRKLKIHYFIMHHHNNCQVNFVLVCQTLHPVACCTGLFYEQ